MESDRGMRFQRRTLIIATTCIVLLGMAVSVQQLLERHPADRPGGGIDGDAATACPPCEIRLRPVASLGSLEDPVGRSMQSLLGRLSSGRYVLAPMFGAPQIALYGGDGRFISMYDRTGQGPGELNTFARRLGMIAGDSIRVWTRGLLLTFDAQLRPVRTVRWDSPAGHVAVLPDGTMLGNYTMRTPDGVSVTHVISYGGHVASMETQQASDPAASLRRLYAAGPDGTFWSARVNEPRVDHYTLDGRHLHTLTPPLDWFTSRTTRSDRGPFLERPQHFNAGLRQLDAAHLVLLTRVPDANWQPKAEEVITTDSELDSTFDTVLTVVNRGTGQVVSAARSDRALVFVEGTRDLVYAPEMVESGDIVLRVWRITLE